MTTKGLIKIIHPIGKVANFESWATPIKMYMKLLQEDEFEVGIIYPSIYIQGIKDEHVMFALGAFVGEYFYKLNELPKLNTIHHFENRVFACDIENIRETAVLLYDFSGVAPQTNKEEQK